MDTFTYVMLCLGCMGFAYTLGAALMTAVKLIRLRRAARRG